MRSGGGIGGQGGGDRAEGRIGGGNAQAATIAVMGSLNMDLIVRTRRAPRPGESIVGLSYAARSGGKGATQAVAAARMGGRVALIGAVGNDAYGGQLLARLAERGGGRLDTSRVVALPGAQTGMAFITLEENGQNRIVSLPGANLAFTKAHLEAQAFPAIAEAAMLVVQLEMNPGVVYEAIRFAAAQGVPVLLNPGPLTGEPLPAELLPLIGCITPNETEAAFLTGIAVETVDDAKRAAVRLTEMGVRRVVVTMGAQGAVAVEAAQATGTAGDPETTTDTGACAAASSAGGAPEPVHIPGRPVQAVDTVGAGDTFTGALAAELCAGSRFMDAVRFACDAAAFAVTREGSIDSMPDRQEIPLFA